MVCVPYGLYFAGVEGNDCEASIGGTAGQYAPRKNKLQVMRAVE